MSDARRRSDRLGAAALAGAWIVALSCGGEPRVPVDTNDDPPVAGFLVENGVYDSELTAPIDVLDHVRFHAPPGFRAVTIGPSRDPIRTFEGLTIVPDFSYSDAPRLEVLVVPSAERHVRPDFSDDALVAFVRERSETARFVVSLCDGAFVLAKAGLLDGRWCTTFPGDVPALRSRHAAARVIDNVSFVVDDKLITSAGGARSFDAALYLVDRLFGSAAARGVGAGLLIDWDLKTVPHLVRDETTVSRGYLPGDRIDPETFVEDASGKRRRLLDLASPDDRVIVLAIFGGAAASVPADLSPRAGLWCEDTLGELGTLRHAIARFDAAGAAFVGIACPPRSHEARFGFAPGAFHAGGAPDERARFAALTEALRAGGLLPFATMGFDFEFRLMRDVEAEPPIAGDPPWLGRFRARDEAQEYGTPTIWILSREGEVLAPPFRGNNFERDGQLRHTSRELEAAIGRAIEVREAAESGR